MHLPRFARSWFAPKSSTVSRKPRGFRPAIEVLESREVPAGFVVNSILDTDNGLAYGTGPTTLRKAVRLANVDAVSDSITFDSALSGLTIKLGGTQLSITKAVSIDGGGDIKIDGNQLSRIFSIDDANANTSLVVSLSGLVLKNGKATGSGGALHNSENLTINGVSFLNHQATVNGGAIDNTGTLTGNGASIFNCSATVSGGAIANTGTLTLTGYSLFSNSSQDSGGALLNNGTANLKSSSFYLNASAKHGGVVENNGTLTVSGSYFSNNSSTKVGGAIDNNATANIASSRFDGNSAGNTGGALWSNGALTVATSTFSSNSSVGDGGALRATGSTVNLRDCTLNANSSASSGGALSSDGATVTLVNTTVSGNFAALGGGGVQSASTLTLINCTVVLNHADSDADSVGSGGGLNAPGALLRNTLVAGNVKGAGAGTPSDIEGGSVSAASDHNLINDPATKGGLTHGVNGNIIGNGLGQALPLSFLINTSLNDNGGPTLTHSLNVNSPALNFGSNASIPAGVSYDQRGAGFARVQFGNVDIGAVEYVPYTYANLNNGVLTLTDTFGVANRFTFSRSGTSLVVTDSAALIVGPSGVASHSLTVALDQVSKLVINTGAGDDVVRFNFASAGFSFTLGLFLDMGTGKDTLQAVGNTNFSLTNTLLRSADGARVQLKNIDIAILQGGSLANIFDARGFTGVAVIDGAAGDDHLYGGNGLNILIGGLGKDILLGGPKDDILLGGRTTLDIFSTGFAQLIDKWNNGNTYANRVAQIRVGSGLPAGIRLNGVTAPNDNAADVITGGGGLDWFWAYAGDVVKDKQAAESLR